MDDTEPAVIEEALERGHAGVKGKVIGQLVQLVLQADLGAGFEIEIIAKGHDGVQAVISAAELHDDENVVIADFPAGDVAREGHARQERGHGRADGDHRQTLQADFH